MVTALAAMVIEMACSQAPAPQSRPESPERILTKIYAVDGTLYVSSRYALTDSFVVIQELLRDRAYYPYEGEAHLYNHPEPVKMPSANLDLPVMLPLKQVKRIEPWKESHETRNGVLGGVGVVVIVVAALMIAFANAFDGLGSD
jgi:hypothetical protein